MKVKLLFSALLGFLAFTFGCAEKEPKNIILCISDGCGYNQIISASYYQFGEQDGFSFQKFPISLAMSTYSEDGERYNPDEAWKDFEYVLRKPTDSAASATAMSTGFNTDNGIIGMSADGDTLQLITELAESLGKSTGVISSVQFSHATPAAFAVHNISRRNYKNIARDMIENSRLDLIMGCGNPHYNNDGDPSDQKTYNYVGGEEFWDQLGKNEIGNDANGDGVDEKWLLVENIEEFRSLMAGPTPDRVIGIPKVYQTLQQSRTGDEYASPYSVPFNDSIPSLAMMVRGALNILDDNSKGFFLMMEGGAIDWACHNNQSGRMIEEEIEFTIAVDSIIAWVEKHSSWDETLIVITGDHETGYLTGPGSGNDSLYMSEDVQKIWRPIGNHGIEKLPGMEWHSHGHSNSLIPLFAKGPGGIHIASYADEHDPVRGYYLDNAELGKALKELWRRD